MNTESRARRATARTGLSVISLAAGALLATGVANADVSGPTVTLDPGCMQKAFSGNATVTNSNKLNCTANDIQISRAIAVSPDTCVAGSDPFDLTATFEIIVTANARYDAGFFFRTDGGANARGDGASATGQCSLSALDPPPPINAPVLDLDGNSQGGPGDSCGDLNSGTYQVTFVIPDVECVAAEGTNQLKLPNCTSWHSNQGTQCTITDPLSADDLGDFKPDTKSKCVCDDDFTVPVTVEDAEIDVLKTANPTQVDEPGGTVTFTVSVENMSEFVSVTIDSIIDTDFGDLAAYPDSTCDDLIGDVLAPGDPAVTCEFDAFVEGNFGDDPHENTVTVTGTQSGNNNEVSDFDDATVDFIDVASAPTVSKDAMTTADCSVDATYQVVVNNSSELDTLTINSLTDDKFGDITTVHGDDGTYEEVVSTDCDSAAKPFSTPIEAGDNYTCEFVGRITDSDCTINHTNTVTADVTDDDGVNSTPSESAVVSGSVTPDP